nr:hypothetical protein [Tanacetum cinerariifolium]
MKLKYRRSLIRIPRIWHLFLPQRTAAEMKMSNGSQIKFEDINQIDEDDMEEIDIKWNMALLSMRADKFWKRTGKKISIQGSDVAGFDKSKVEYYNCHKMGHFAIECRAPRSQERGRKENYRQGSKAKEKTPKALTAIDGKKTEPNSQNMAFISSAKHSSRNEDGNIACVPTASTNVPTIDEDDMEEMDIKWNMALLSMRADKFWKRTGKKISIQGSDVAGFDKSKVECFNSHKIAEEQALKALMEIYGVGWDWSYMANDGEDHALVADEEAPTKFALMANTSTESK